MVVVISAMAPSCRPSLHGSSRLSRASSGGGSMPSPPRALAEKDAQDTLFTDEEFQALVSGQSFTHELLPFSENDRQSPSSPLLSLQLQAQQLCREDDAYAWFQDQETPPPFALDDDLEAPSLFCDEVIQVQALFHDEEIQAPLCAAPEPQQPSMQFSRAATSSPPWPSCIVDGDDEGEETRPPPLALPPPFPPLPKKARTQTKRRSRCEHGPPPLPPRPMKKARVLQTKTRGSREHARAMTRLQHRLRLRDVDKTIATRILTRQFRPPELSLGRTALRCQCPELAVAGDERGGLGCCALHQDALPEHRAWMFSSLGHAPPLVGGPGQVLVPVASKGDSKAMVLQYVRWRRSVSLPTRFYVQRAVEKQGWARSAAA